MISIDQLLELEKKHYPNYKYGIVSQYVNEWFLLEEEKKQKLIQYGITDAEYIVILLLCGNLAGIFQKHLIEGRFPNELEAVLCSLLDSTLDKLPSADCKCLGRYDTYSEPAIYKENSDIQINYYLTTTCSAEFGSVAGTKMLWIITPLSKEETQARCIYEIHDLPVAERQVNFKRNTKFHIDRIERSDDYPYPLMYVTELKP